MSVSNSFRNPVISGFNPDPTICHVPGKGYFISTSTFEFFPGLPIYHSTDLVNWKLIGHAINRRSQGVDMRSVETSAGLWAPTLRYHKGRWYMACACFWRMRVSGKGADMISSGFYVSTDDIFDDSKWSDAVYFDEVGFDQDLLFDDDGKTYLTTTRFDFSETSGRRAFKIKSWTNEIDLYTGASLTPPKLVSTSPLGVSEGCHIYKMNGFYYLFTAEGGTEGGHRECVYRSKSPLGPFEPPPEGINPLIFNDDHPDIQNTGHMDFAQGDDGKWVAVFLGVRPSFEAAIESHGGPGMPTQLGRETFMAPMKWIDGWPIVNEKKPIELVGKFEGLNLLPSKRSWRDDFKESNLELGWYHVRVPLRPTYSLTKRSGYLSLYGAADTLTTDGSPSVLLRKQVSFDLNWSTQMEFGSGREGEEAGTLVYTSSGRHAALGLRKEKDVMKVVFRQVRVDGSVEKTFNFSQAPETPITFLIKARRAEYQFSYLIEGEKQVDVGTISSTVFQPMFGGVHIGLYAQGWNDQPSIAPAYFKYAEYMTIDA